MSKEPDEHDNWPREWNLTLALAAVFGSVSTSFSLFGLLSDIFHLRLSIVAEKLLREYRNFFEPLVTFFRPDQLDDMYPESAYLINLLSNDLVILLMIFGGIYARALAVTPHAISAGDQHNERPRKGLRGYFRFLASEAWLSVSMVLGIGLIAGFALLLPFIGYAFAALVVLTTLSGMKMVTGSTFSIPLISSFAENDRDIALRAGYIGWGALLFLPVFFLINAYSD